MTNEELIRLIGADYTEEDAEVAERLVAQEGEPTEDAWPHWLKKVVAEADEIRGERNADMCAVVRYARSKQTAEDWRVLRYVVAGSLNREQGVYYYKCNGGTRRLRVAGKVAWVVLETARRISGDEIGTYPAASWCGKWRRTVCSIQAEQDGERTFRAALEIAKGGRRAQ